MTPYRSPSLLKALATGTTVESAQPFNVNVWKSTDHEKRVGGWSLECLAYRDEFTALGRPIQRADVFKAFAKGPITRGIAWTIVWGYPKGRSSRNGRKPIALMFSNLEAIAEKVEAIRNGPTLAATQIVAQLNKMPGLGTSTSTKIAYFAGLVAREGECLIYDRQVMASILTCHFRELARLKRGVLPKSLDFRNCKGGQIEKATRAQHRTYGLYVKTLTELALVGGVPSETIELFLFKKAPNRVVAARFNSQWEKIKLKRKG